MNKLKIRLIALSTLLLAILIFAMFLYLRNVTIFSSRLESSKKIDITAEQIRSIKDIGQWEFLAISEEELVDTVRKGILSDDHLVRIYHGTLRLGIDLKKLDESQLSLRGDTLHIVLPPVTLLDENFIDEADTRSFHQTGNWQPADREAMYLKAKQLMKSHALTSQNIQTAKEYGESQVRNLLTNMGFKHSVITFSSSAD